MPTNDVVVVVSSQLEGVISSGFQPLYFFLGIACGILFINLFKGRWFI